MAGSVYYYKMTVDAGGAPCVRRGLLSLAICKPMLRATAKEGDVVIGLASDRIGKDNGVVYVARIHRNLRNGEYYRDARYRGRPDCIYRFRYAEWVQVRNAFHKPEDIGRDLGKKREHAHVLVSREFRYFGANRYKVNWSVYPALRRKVDRLLRGHRVRHSDAVETELRALSKTLFAVSSRKVLGDPTHGEKGRCNREDREPVGVC